MAATLSVNEMYLIEQDILNKNQNGYLDPEQFDRINNQAQFDYLNSILGDVRKYVIGRPIPAAAWGMTARVRESLTPFITTPISIIVDPVTGIATDPSDYEMWDAMYWGPTRKRVKFIQQGRLASHVNSTVNPIVKNSIVKNPIFIRVEEGFTVYPFNIGTVELSYIRTPQTIHWGYDEDPDGGEPIYNPATSTNPEWQRIDCMQIIARAMDIMGVSLQAAQVAQYANNIKNVGQ
jgi:hypothetical protein